MQVTARLLLGLLIASVFSSRAFAGACRNLDELFREAAENQRRMKLVDPPLTKANVATPYKPGEVPRAFASQDHRFLMKSVYEEAAKAQGKTYDQFVYEASLNHSATLGDHVYKLSDAGVIVTKDTLDKVANGEIRSFVVFPSNKKMAVTEWRATDGDHAKIGMGANVSSAGEVRITKDAATGKITEIEINLKSGSYKIGDKLSAFRAAVRSFLNEGIQPEKFILKDFSSDDKMINQKVLSTLKPPYK